MGNSDTKHDKHSSINHVDSLQISHVSMPIMHSQYLKNFKNKPTPEHQPSRDYAIMVDSRPQLSHAAKVSLSNMNNRKTLDSSFPVYFIREYNAYYQGNWHQRLPHGIGNAYFGDGCYYEGQFQHGEAKCQHGLLIYPNGAVFEGQILQSTIQGFGKLTYPQQIMTYMGHWQRGQPQGIGQEVYFDGSIFQGNFVNGVKQGPGKLTWNNKTIQYNGKFVDGQANDQGAVLKNFLQNTEYVGGFCEGNKHGHGRLINRYGQLEGYFTDNFITGKGVFKWKDGRTYLGQFENNELHGNGKIIFPNGQVIEGIWEKGNNKAITSVHNRKVPIEWSYFDPSLRTQFSGKPHQPTDKQSLLNDQ